MPQRSLVNFYEPNLRLTRAYGLLGYNAGYADAPDQGSFDQHQKDLVWRLLSRVPISRENTVLDVGCGIGGPSGWILERYQPSKVIGLEFTPTSVRVAEENWSGKMPRPYFVQGDAQRIPLPDESVDVIFNLESALHYSDKDAFVSECKRILKPGGVLCLGDICTRRKKIFAFFGLLDMVAGQFSTRAKLWSAEQYLSCFNAQGLRVLHHEEVSKGAADSLAGGLAMIGKKGWKAARGFRGRFFYLCFVAWLLRRGWMSYELFNAVKP